MKNCPNCGAEIQDNARFCVHCMTSLIPKTKAAVPDVYRHSLFFKRILPFLAGGVIIAAVAIFGPLRPVIFSEQNGGPNHIKDPTDPFESMTEESLSEPEESETKDESVQGSEGAEGSETEEETVIPEETYEDPSQSLPSQAGNGRSDEPGESRFPTGGTVPSAESRTEQSSESNMVTDGTENETSAGTQGTEDDSTNSSCNHFFRAATCTAPKTCRYCGTTEGEPLGHTVVFGFCQRCNQNVVSGTKAEAIAEENARYEAEVQRIEEVFEQQKASYLDSYRIALAEFGATYPPSEAWWAEFSAKSGDADARAEELRQVLLDLMLNSADPAEISEAEARYTEACDEREKYNTVFLAKSDAEQLLPQLAANRTYDLKYASDVHEETLQKIEAAYP